MSSAREKNVPKISISCPCAHHAVNEVLIESTAVADTPREDYPRTEPAPSQVD